MSGKPNINTDSVRGLAATHVRAAEQVGQAIPGGRLMRDTIPGLCDEIDHLRQECRDRECTEQDVRARLADAENTLAKVRGLAFEWDEKADKAEGMAISRKGLSDEPQLRTVANVTRRRATELRAALDGTS